MIISGPRGEQPKERPETVLSDRTQVPEQAGKGSLSLLFCLGNRERTQEWETGPPPPTRPAGQRVSQLAKCYAFGQPGASIGAGDGNRTHVTSLEGWNSTIELHPHIKMRNRLYFSIAFLRCQPFSVDGRPGARGLGGGGRRRPRPVYVPKRTEFR